MNVHFFSQKIEGKMQCTGEAEYIADFPQYPHELQAAFVLSEKGNCEIEKVDPSAALEMQGVVAFVDHKYNQFLNFLINE